MNKKRNDLLAGLFILICAALAVAVVVTVKDLTGPPERTQIVRARFSLSDGVAGLVPGAEVRLGGAQAGRVNRVSLESDGEGDGFVLVEFDMPARFVVRQDTVVRIEKDVTGPAAINVGPLGTGEPVDASFLLQGRPGTLAEAISSVATLAPQLSQTATELRDIVGNFRSETLPRVNRAIDDAATTSADFRATSARARDVIDQVSGQVPAAFDRYNALTDRLISLATHLDEIFGDGKTDLRQTLAAFRGATVTLDQRLPGLLDEVQALAGDLRAGVDDARVVLQQVRAVGDDLQVAVTGARSLVTQNRGRIDNMIASLKNTADNLENASAEIRRSPWRLLYQPRADELRNLDVFDSARQFAGGARNLNDAATALRDALQDPNVPPDRIQQLLNQLETSFENFGKVESALFERVR